MSGPVKRRKIQELVERYRRVRIGDGEIFVEGREDKRLLDRFFRLPDSPDVTVYPIESVEVPDQMLRERGLAPHSARNRVIVLAETLAKSGVDIEKIRFLVDRDQEDFVPTPDLPESIVLTEFGTFSMVVADGDALAHLADIFCNESISKEEFVLGLLETVRTVFFIRASTKKLGIPLRIGDFSAFVGVQRGKIVFDEIGFIHRMALLGSFRDRIPEIMEEVGRCRIYAMENGFGGLATANDHDLMLAALRIIRLCGGLRNRSEDDVRNLLEMRLDLRALGGSSVVNRLT